jgi:hypothetical protein
MEAADGQGKRRNVTHQQDKIVVIFQSVIFTLPLSVTSLGTPTF